ncbi:zinc finger protein 618-like isoform X4 [Protopterus annectens]|uniref:zinc finger protein 618-like isoform X4 n=1 Tax=Protopterus annectens TaxID=7888 RepID=UPI001CFA7FF8|nr:zinc finger protein 618-like isoform X4 [Protopterus annectens]
MTSEVVNVKTEKPDEVQDTVWHDKTKDDSTSVDGAGEVQAAETPGDVPAEICVVIGGARNQQVLGAYECGICGKKYKYYNCFQTHVRAHRENCSLQMNGTAMGASMAPTLANLFRGEFKYTESASGEGSSQGNNFRYTCDICGKRYKYYSCFQEHRDLHAVDDPYDQAVKAAEEAKEEEPEPLQKIGPKTGSYVCEFCGKQYKYYTPYQEHVALHAPIKHLDAANEADTSRTTASEGERHSRSSTPRRFVVTGQLERLIGSHRKESFGKGTIRYDTVGSTPEREEKSDSAGGTKELLVRKREAASPLILSPLPQVQKPYTCGACGIQFQFYNNLLEHMQSHAADNENSVAPIQSKSPSSVISEENWKQQYQRNSSNNAYNSLPEKERQYIAGKLLRVMCADLGSLSVLNGKEFIKLAQTLVDTGSRYGAFSISDTLGNFNTLALKHLPRMYNQVKVKVTCALGSSACFGIGVTCHSHSIGTDSCCILTAHQVEGNKIRRYLLGIKDLDVRENGEYIHHWVQNVLSEFVMSEIKMVYVTDTRVSPSSFSKAGMCLQCSACALNSVVHNVLNKRTLQARNMHDVIELLNVCDDLAASSGLSKETCGSMEEMTPPPCWNSITDSLLLVHEKYEHICEFYNRVKKMNHIQNLNKHLLNNLSSILAPVKQAVIELSSESKPTLQLVLPTYVKLEKLFTSKANDIGTVSKLCHLFLEALKENFKVEVAHKVAMVLDPQQKLRPVPPYQHEEIISKVCELIAEIRESSADEGEFEPTTKKIRSESKAQGDDRFGKNEVYEYLQEPLFQATPDLFQYWSSVTQKHTKLAKLAFWLLAVPAVGARSEYVSMCEQTLLMKRKKQLSPEEMNKLIFLKSNMP